MVPLLDSNEIRQVSLRIHFAMLSVYFPLSNASKVRIIALYVQFREGVPDEDRRRLFQHARISRADQDAITNLLHLGVRVTRVCGPIFFPVPLAYCYICRYLGTRM